MSHITRERISALMEDPGGDADAERHLERCEACSRERERMRRMRMALSAMSDLEPPTGAWERIEAALSRTGSRGKEASADFGAGRDAAGARDPAGAPGPRRSAATRVDIGWADRARRLLSDRGVGLRAAAAVILFFGGTWLGVSLRDAGPAATGSGGEVAGVSAADRPTAAADRSGIASGRTDGGREPAGVASGGVGSGGSADARQWLAELRSLRSRGPNPQEVVADPGRAAAHLARLDALIQASSAYIQDVPSDPEVNDFLFEVVEERNSLGRALRFASLEYR